MSEEEIKQPENTETAPVVPAGETAAGQPAQPAPATRKGDPWKTAFIVLAGISVISAGVFYLAYGRRNDLPTTPANVDPNAQPVQMANPPTGQSEQTAMRLQPQVVGNAADMQVVPGGYDPWANPGRFQSNMPMPVSPPGQQMYIEPNSNSPFMQDGNTYIIMPANSNTATNANKAAPNANKPKPTTSPLPMPTPAVTNPPANPPAGNKPAPPPANKPAKTPVKGKPRST